MLNINRAVFYFLVAFFILRAPFQIYAQEKAPASWKSLAQKMASEREKIVSYKVNIALKSQTFSSLDSSVASNVVEKDFYFEFSRLENHFVYARRNSNEKDKDYKGWAVRGQSDGVKFGGGGKILVAGDEIDSSPLYFDPLALGLSFCRAFNGYLSYEDALLEYTMYPQGTYKIELEKDGIIGVRSSADFSYMRVDPKKGYWPFHFEITRLSQSEYLKERKREKTQHLVTLALEEFNENFLPTKAEYSCFEDGNKGRLQFSLTLRWQNVNQPITTGQEAVNAVAKTLGMQVTELK